MHGAPPPLKADLQRVRSCPNHIFLDCRGENGAKPPAAGILARSRLSVIARHQPTDAEPEKNGSQQ